MSAMPDPQAARAIQGHLKELVKSLKKYDVCRKGSEGGLDSINELHRFNSTYYFPLGFLSRYLFETGKLKERGC